MQELTSEEFGVNTFSVSMEGEGKLSDEDMMRTFEHVSCHFAIHIIPLISVYN